MTSRIVWTLGLIALGAAWMPWQSATAAELGIYAGVAYAQVDNQVDKGAFDAQAIDILLGQDFVPATATTSFDAKGPGYSFVVGYRMFPWLAVEGGYMDLGKVSYRIASDGIQGGVPATANLSLNTKSSGIALSALGILPLSYRWEVYGRVGALFATNRLSLFLSDSIGDASGTLSNSKTNALAGVGISMSLAEIYAVRAEYQRVFSAEAERIGKGDVDLLTIGVTVQF